jgi:hypothetical protein
LTAFDHIRGQQLLAIEQDPNYGPQLRTWRAETAHLGPEDWVPPKPEVPRHLLPRWCVNEYPATDYLAADRLKVQIYLDDRSRVPQKSHFEKSSVITIYNEVKTSDPNAIVISNCLPDGDAITPAKAKGSNDYIGQRIYHIMLHPAPDKYRDLLIENAVFSARNFVKLEFVDDFDQIAHWGSAIARALRRSLSCRRDCGSKSGESYSPSASTPTSGRSPPVPSRGELM